MTDRLPELMIEVGSPSTRSRHLGMKADRYARENIEEYWFVDLDHERVVVHRRDGATWTTGIHTDRATSPLLGTDVDLAALFTS